ncbi:MAG: PHP domain-containing protein [Candidatus Omnitrophica bacterium]|nr:PHP domain-containing protein [Candidatus Omnitrophota bacterium]
MKKIDLHMHTTHSDGSYLPRELVRYAGEKGLGSISVTDHDTMSSFEECADEAKKLGIELIPGIEISCDFEPGTLHVLGYFMDRNQPGFKAVLDEIQKARRERNPEIIRKLNQLGIEITLEEVTAVSGGKQVGRPHFAKILVKKGAVKTMDEAFWKYLAKGKPAYVDKRRLSSKEGIQKIREAGGIAVAAHPKQMKLAGEALTREIKRLVDEGLGGIEAYNSCQNRDEARLYKELAKRFNLLVTGGSDFHGANKPEVDLGYLGGGVELGYEVVESMKASLAKR